jgi:hypothetical protein
MTDPSAARAAGSAAGRLVRRVSRCPRAQPAGTRARFGDDLEWLGAFSETMSTPTVMVLSATATVISEVKTVLQVVRWRGARDGANAGSPGPNVALLQRIRAAFQRLLVRAMDSAAWSLARPETESVRTFHRPISSGNSTSFFPDSPIAHPSPPPLSCAATGTVRSKTCCSARSEAASSIVVRTALKRPTRNAVRL